VATPSRAEASGPLLDFEADLSLTVATIALRGWAAHSVWFQKVFSRGVGLWDQSRSSNGHQHKPDRFCSQAADIPLLLVRTACGRNMRSKLFESAFKKLKMAIRKCQANLLRWCA
jgi:hypothetical protein